MLPACLSIWQEILNEERWTTYVLCKLMNKTDEGVRKSHRSSQTGFKPWMSPTFMKDVCALLNIGLEKSISMRGNCKFAWFQHSKYYVFSKCETFIYYFFQSFNFQIFPFSHETPPKSEIFSKKKWLLMVHERRNI